MPIQPPFMVSYSITTKCNLKCKHCYGNSVEQAAPDELSTEEALHLVDDLSRWGIGLLIIDGGEPLCQEDLLDIERMPLQKENDTILSIDRAINGKGISDRGQQVFSWTETELMLSRSNTRKKFADCQM